MTRRNSYSQVYVPLSLQDFGRKPPLIEEVNALKIYNPDGILNIPSTNRAREKEFRNVRRRQDFGGQHHEKHLEMGEDGLLRGRYVPIS